MSTICAPATSLGGAIAIIRVSGPDTIPVINRIFTKDIKDARGYTVHYGQIVEGSTNEVIDEVLVTVFRAPHSYTGEDSAEISCHASKYIVQRICSLLCTEGCQPAAAGEFTKRAFLGGKMDLSQAEAVADIIASENKASHDIALSQMKGTFSNELAILREQLLKLTSLLELELDFSDHEELEFANRDELRELADTIDNRITTLAHSFENGQAIKNGIPVAIIGKTNVGKSTLLNQLIHEDRAIVSNIHGTTRDVIEDTTTINGITFRFIDTAGIRTTEDEVERLGIERTHKKMKEARIILWVIDTAPSKEEISEIEDFASEKSVIMVCNKVDKQSIDSIIGQDILPNVPRISISAKYGTNINELEKTILAAANIPEIHNGDIIITNARHYDALCRAHTDLCHVRESLSNNLSGDLISEDLHSVISDLADITGGAISSQETLNNIFKNFCIGK